MHRIDSRSAHNGTFRAGNPIDGTPPTALTPEWFNTVQEELANVVVAANMPLDKTDNGQLLKALKWLIADAVSKLNNGGGDTGGGTTNHPPTTPTVITDLPAQVVRGNSYDVKFTATDQDNDAITFSISNLVGCTAAQTTGINSAGTSINIGAQTDSVSFAVVAVDAKGAASAAATVTRSGSAIVNPTASTGWLTAGQTHVIDVPDWADTATVSACGGAGTAESNGCPAGQYLDQIISDTDTGQKILSPILRVSNGGSWYYPDSGATIVGLPTDFVSNNSLGAGACLAYDSNKNVLNYMGLAAASTVNAPGTATAITGAVSATFAGAASGVTTAPTVSTQVKTLPSGAGRKITVVIPSTGSCKVDWS